MNWKQIQKKYPKAYKKMILGSFRKTLEYKLAPGDVLTEQPHHIMRSLYDFFDKQKICGYTLLVKKTRWGYDIFGHFIIPSTLNFKSRKSAEKALFTKCFEILEGRLK